MARTCTWATLWGRFLSFSLQKFLLLCAVVSGRVELSLVKDPWQRTTYTVS